MKERGSICITHYARSAKKIGKQGAEAFLLRGAKLKKQNEKDGVVIFFSFGEAVVGVESFACACGLCLDVLHTNKPLLA